MPAGPLKIDTTYSGRSTRSGSHVVSQKIVVSKVESAAPAVTADTTACFWDSDESELTPLTSPVEPTLPILPKRETTLGEPRNGGEPIANPAISSKSTSLKGKRQVMARKGSTEEHTVGSHVWVLLDREARILEPKDAETPAARRKDWIWWPAKVTEKTARAVKVHLYGSPLPGKQAAEIRTPGKINLLSLHDSKSRLRYSTPTFVDLTTQSTDACSSPRKRQKLDRSQIESRWRQGLAELRVDQKLSTLIDDSDDDMPAVGTLGFDMFTASLGSIAENEPVEAGIARGKRKRSPSVRSLSEAPSDWTPPPPDELLKIPGDGVLACEDEKKMLYWPARILEYVPPENPSQEPRYLVEYLDTIKKAIPRDWFFTTEQDEFGTCKLGKWESLYQEVEDDEDSDVVNGYAPRSPSPEPREPPPEPQDFIVNLSMREQLSYTKPVLQAILHASYLPALERHTRYLAGGQSRKTVVDMASLRGNMDPRDVRALQDHLNEWCLRELKIPTKVEDEEDEDRQGSRRDLTEAQEQPVMKEQPEAPPSPVTSESALSISELPPASSFTPSEHGQASSSETESRPPEEMFIPPPRQLGCEEYEALSNMEKLDYCLNVLLPEAIQQILLWRGGFRRSVQLLPVEEEVELYKKASSLVRETDWACDIMRFRNLKEKQEKKKNEKGAFSAAGRRKRNVAVPKSYLEDDV